MFDENEFLKEAKQNDSYTSPVLEDTLLPDGTYLWDCCNTDYCKKFDAANYKLSCLRASHGERCPYEKRLKIRANAKANGFKFPDFQGF